MDAHTLIIGASISGLASAASLQQHNIEYILIEKNDCIASPWRHHYERLHLHTNKRVSHLPYKQFNNDVPRYPSRLQLINYLESYQHDFNIRPLFQTEAISAVNDGEHWAVTTSKGLFRSKYLIMATGAYGRPRTFEANGMETFRGSILHSCQYRSGRDFSGQHVLVIGFGNSACEIAMDLYEQDAIPSMSVRSPLNVIPRDLLGIPVLEISLLLKALPPSMADAISAPFISWLIGDLSGLGLTKLPYGPLEQIHRDGQSPVLDIGTIRHIRQRHIDIFPGIDHIAENTVSFTDGRQRRFDAIVAAIGYERDSCGFLKVDKTRTDDLRLPADKQKYFGKDGLYFCGYWISPTGQIREIKLDAQKIAADIASKERH